MSILIVVVVALPAVTAVIVTIIVVVTVEGPQEAVEGPLGDGLALVSSAYIRGTQVDALVNASLEHGLPSH